MTFWIFLKWSAIVALGYVVVQILIPLIWLGIVAMFVAIVAAAGTAFVSFALVADWLQRKWRRWTR